MSHKKFTVTLGGFSSISAKTPYDAANQLADLLTNDYEPKDLTYDVIDEATQKAFTVDLAEEKEDAVLPSTNLIAEAKRLLLVAISRPMDEVDVAEIQNLLKNL